MMLSMRQLNKTHKPIVHAALLLLLVPSLFPFYYLLVGSVKSPAEFITNFWGPPSSPVWGNLGFAVRAIGWTVVNSIIVSFAVCAGTLMLATPAAYGISQLIRRGKHTVFMAFTIPMMVPGALTLPPLFIVTRDLGLLNSYWGLIVPQVAGSLPLAIFLLTRFFDQVPAELLEAARIDGAREASILWHMLIPLSTPVLATVAVLNVLASWNNYLWPLVCVRDADLRTVPMGLAFASTENYLLFDTGRLLAVYLVGSIPLALFFIFAMKPFMRGISAGAVKA
jgi:ABC-type glycerol-3-phosphate transport system permease component